MRDFQAFRKGALTYWERRRIIYNLALVLPALFGFALTDNLNFVGDPHPIHYHYVLLWFALCALGANICYSFAYGLEFLFGSDEPTSRWLRFGRTTAFVGGILLAMLLALVGGYNVAQLHWDHSIKEIRRSATYARSIRLVIQRIESVNVNLGEYSSYLEYHERVYGQIDDSVHLLSLPYELKALFIECHRRWMHAPELAQEKLKWINPHAEACQAILFRIAEIDSDDATRVLVDLYSDAAFGWDGEFALNAANAISRCGKRALPYLTRTKNGRRVPHAQQIAQCIINGGFYGP